MKKLTDTEMSYMRSLRSLGLNRELDALVGPAIDKLLANYQEQLEIESYGRAELQRYTEANSAPTVVDVDVRNFGGAQ